MTPPPQLQSLCLPLLSQALSPSLLPPGIPGEVHGTDCGQDSQTPGFSPLDTREGIEDGLSGAWIPTNSSSTSKISQGKWAACNGNATSRQVPCPSKSLLYGILDCTLLDAPTAPLITAWAAIPCAVDSAPKVLRNSQNKQTKNPQTENSPLQILEDLKGIILALSQRPIYCKDRARKPVVGCKFPQ